MEIGQKVYLRPQNNAARRSTEIKEATITKVGRKYFEVEPKWYGRFEIETMYQDGGDYTPNYQAYFSLEEIEEEKELNKLHREVGKFFTGYGKPDISPSQIRAIADILGIK